MTPEIIERIGRLVEHATKDRGVGTEILISSATAEEHTRSLKRFLHRIYGANLDAKDARKLGNLLNDDIALALASLIRMAHLFGIEEITKIIDEKTRFYEGRLPKPSPISEDEETGQLPLGVS